jgi:hypothetical protein
MHASYSNDPKTIGYLTNHFHLTNQNESFTLYTFLPSLWRRTVFVTAPVPVQLDLCILG